MEQLTEDITITTLEISEDTTNSERMMDLIREFAFATDIKQESTDRISFRLKTDKRGVELFVNKLIQTNFHNIYNIRVNDFDNIISVSIPKKNDSEIRRDFQFAFGKLLKYAEYKELIAKFAPGAGSHYFPGYCFEDFEMKH